MIPPPTAPLEERPGVPGVRELTLAIEASNPASPRAGTGPRAAGVAIGLVPTEDDGAIELLGAEALRHDAGPDDDLLPAIARLSERLGVRARQFRRVAVSVGPGGFTGVRVSVAAAKMIALSTGAGCVAVPTALAILRRVDATLRAARSVTVLLAWKRTDAWCTRFAPGVLTPLGTPGLMSLEAPTFGPADVIVADRALLDRLVAEGRIPERATAVEPAFDPIAVLEAGARVVAVDPSELNPLYPREPEAVTKWRSLHPPRGPGSMGA